MYLVSIQFTLEQAVVKALVKLFCIIIHSNRLLNEGHELKESYKTFSSISTCIEKSYYLLIIIVGNLETVPGKSMPGGPKKKLKKKLSYDSGCLAVIIRLLFNLHDALDCE